ESALDRIGPPPSGGEPHPAADRTGLRPVGSASRRFRARARIGFVASLLVSGLGLWAIAALLLGSA
ncbi:hypothetical protein, partial [Leucobacter sp. M11]|uniref:hypothetical protein n=1 Tax=Leucobacter sp. M11 TaxID=2993565 RepID=UPI002D7E2314